MALERARVVSGNLRFNDDGGFARALDTGCFLLAIPPELDVQPGVILCREFYREPVDGSSALAAYRGFRKIEGIYFDREHFQTEHLLLDGPARTRYFPDDVVGMCVQMNQLGLLVLRAALGALGVSGSLWSEVTGGAVDGQGTHWFAASHYRPERDQLGCAPHKDTGFVTILYIEQPGLEAYTDGTWVSVDPVPGFFVVNFGGAFELLTQALRRPVKAILHRVRKCSAAAGVEDRFSFAAFANPPTTGNLYQVYDDGSASTVQSVEEFLREFNETTWHDRYDDFGITPAAGQGAAAASEGRHR
jgi:2-oxoglutarate-Fe(II)-dependent oxygenase superfamily protein